MKNEVEVEVEINGDRIPNSFKLDIERDAESKEVTSLKLEFYISKEDENKK